MGGPRRPNISNTLSEFEIKRDILVRDFLLVHTFMSTLSPTSICTERNLRRLEGLVARYDILQAQVEAGKPIADRPWKGPLQ